MPGVTHALRPDRWSVVVAPDGYPQEIDDFEWAEQNPDAAPSLYGKPWDAGRPEYANPHEFDRRAVAAFLSPADAGLVDDWCRLADDGNFTHDYVGGARALLIREWEGMGEPVYPDRHGLYTEAMLRANANSGRAGTYLHCRGLNLAAICALREPLSQVIAKVGLGDGRKAPTPDPGRPDDDLDRVLYALAVGLTAPEIAPGLRDGNWPSIDTLTLMGSLRS